MTLDLMFNVRLGASTGRGIDVGAPAEMLKGKRNSTSILLSLMFAVSHLRS
jgi:hypothetical protein